MGLGNKYPQRAKTPEPCSVSLDNFSQTLRPYQSSAVEHALGLLYDVERAQELGYQRHRWLYAAPAGSGKGTIELALLKRLLAEGHDAWILTPNLDIIRGFLERCGATDLTRLSTDRLDELGLKIRVTTPTKFRNRMMDGDYTAPDVILYDEVHHAIENNVVSGDLFAIAPGATYIGFTATPYRATPKSTKALRDAWGEPWVILTIPEAIEQGYQALPTFRVVPLVDDDQIKVVAGQFQVKSSTKIFASRATELALLIADVTGKFNGGNPELLADMPTAITVPSSEAARELVMQLGFLMISADWISQKTTAAQRTEAYARCRQRKSVLISIKVLGEGWDAPWLRRIIDARPTLSSVAWVQLLGRIMRPGPIRPEYISCCRNLERFAWLLQGAIPAAKVAEAQQAFDLPSKRAGHRSIGFERLARFRIIQVPLAGGLVAAGHALYSVDSDTGVRVDWFTLLSPTSDKTLVASRTVQPVLAGQEVRPSEAYGDWYRAELPETLTGYARSSQHTGSLSVKMHNWWVRAAARYGLDPLAADKITRRVFSILPVLRDLKLNALSWDKTT